MPGSFRERGRKRPNVLDHMKSVSLPCTVLPDTAKYDKDRSHLWVGGKASFLTHHSGEERSTNSIIFEWDLSGMEC